MGVEPGLEAVQGVSHHNPLRQTVPVWYSSREERHLSVLCPAGGDVIDVVVIPPLIIAIGFDHLVFPTCSLIGKFITILTFITNF